MINFVDYDELEHKISVDVVADSISSITLHRITTLKLRIPRVILPELTRHRVYSFSVASSRAKRVERVVDELGFEPTVWLKNHKGMQGFEELDPIQKFFAQLVWSSASYTAMVHALVLNKIGLSKQYTNRGIENYTYIDVLMTGTEWLNFLLQRDHQSAMFEIQVLARRIELALDLSKPKILNVNEWHLPFITDYERVTNQDETLLKISAARCARVSYGSKGSDGNWNKALEDDVRLYERLVNEKPPHLSPLEHQAKCVDIQQSGNLQGFLQHRKLLIP